MFSEIFIDDYCNFYRFSMDFPNYRENNKPNLNILVGRNGSGKSSLLDALYEIGKNNLRNKISEDVKNQARNCDFKYQVFLGSKQENILCEDPLTNEKKHLNYETKIENLWNKVIRLHTGHTLRQNTYLKEDFSYLQYRFPKVAFKPGESVSIPIPVSADTAVRHDISLESDETKWALLAIFLSGKWQNKCTDKDNNEKGLWDDVQKLVLGSSPEEECTEWIEPKILWIETNLEYEEKEISEEFSDSEFNNFIKDLNIRKPDFSIPMKEGKVRHYWNLKENISKENKDWSLHLLIKLLNLKNIVLTVEEDISSRLKLFDTGFLYSKVRDNIDNNILFPDQTLSDGEHAFLTRFALLMILRESKPDERYLILLDEPETHFNEHWKTWFLHLVCESLNGKDHDVFVATHSAMLITDAKPEEVHRLESRENGIKHHPVPINTYGANVVDIGQSLFKMEADIGKRSRDEIKLAIKTKDKAKLEKLLKQVGPGEWRWRIRAKLNELEKQETHK